MVKCSLCGRDNPEGSRFCASCGEPLKNAEENATKTQISELRKNLKPEGRGKCLFCHKVTEIYFGRCGYCGELMDTVTEGVDTGISLDAKVDEIVAATLQSIEGEGVDIEAIRDDLISALRQRAEELIKSKVKDIEGEIKSNNIESIAEDVGNIIASEAVAMASTHEEKVSVATPHGEIEARRLDKQKECFICLGTIGPKDPFVVCECGMYYHRTCANYVGYCPNCGKRFT